MRHWYLWCLSYQIVNFLVSKNLRCLEMITKYEVYLISFKNMLQLDYFTNGIQTNPSCELVVGTQEVGLMQPYLSFGHHQIRSGVLAIVAKYQKICCLPSNKAGVVGHYHQVGHDDVIFDNRHACLLELCFMRPQNLIVITMKVIIVRVGVLCYCALLHKTTIRKASINTVKLPSSIVWCSFYIIITYSSLLT